MRCIEASAITAAVRDCCIRANRFLPDDLCARITECEKAERDPLAKSIFSDMQKNIEAASELTLPICQDTGMAVVFADIGQDCHIVGGSFEQAINAGVSSGYTQGRLRASVVADPIRRGNTGDNTPAIIHTRIVDGDRLRLVVAPKGFGSENMSRIFMLTPSVSREDIIDRVCAAVKEAGGNPCPPVVLGVGIGGDFEKCALLSKLALCRPVSVRNSDEFYAKLEDDMLSAVNSLGIGAQGFGGDVTALAVNIETGPTHIAGLPLAVNVGCHVTRHCEVII